MGEMVDYEGEAGQVQAYLARPEVEGARPALVLVHDIYGLSGHTRSVAERLAAQGYGVLAPNLFSRPGLAEAMTGDNIRVAMDFSTSLQRERMGDRAYLQQEIEKLPEDRRERVKRTFPLIFGGLPRASLVQDLVHGVNYLRGQSFVTEGKVGSVGFCFGGGMSIFLATQTKLAACAVFYGENPDPIELVEKIDGPVLGLYGAEDNRINIHLDTLVGAMARYHKDFEMRIYPNAAHAFFNDANPNSYREAAARESWERLLRFYQRTLG